MDVAVISVISSGLVALGTILVTFIGGERQRKHEASLDFEKRVWDRKSEAIFVIIQTCRVLADSDGPITDKNRLTWALELSSDLDTCVNTRPTIEAFASQSCRDQLTNLIDFMRKSGIVDGANRRQEFYNKKAFEINPLEHREEYMRWRGWTKEIEAQAVEKFSLDLPELRKRALDLIDAARESARRAVD